MNQLILVCLLLPLFGSAALQAQTKNSLLDAIEEGVYEAAHRYENIDGVADARIYQKLPFETADQKNYDLVIVASGGWNSCQPGPYGQVMSEHIFQLRKRLFETKKIKSRLVMTCFPKYSKRIYYFTTSAPNDLRYGLTHDIVNVTSLEAERTTSKSAMVIGYSYGGWLAMSLADQLPASYKIRALVSVDPISMELCRPTDIATWYYKHFKTAAFANACQTAPQDFSAVARKNILKKVGWWLNFFQLDSDHLHSAVIPEIQDNVLISFKGSVVGSEKVLGHGRIISDDRVWSLVSERILESVAK
jgi:hypothetical protein